MPQPTVNSQTVQRLIELGRLSATLLHEISNPLTSALLHLEQYENQNSKNIREARRSIRVLSRYVSAARQQVRRESALTSFSIKSQVGQLKRIVAPVAKTAGVTLTIEPLPDCRISGDAVKFQQVLANLIINAIEAYGDTNAKTDKPVKVGVCYERSKLTINVLDRGRGIQRADLRNIFEPFYTTKSTSRHGLGIGLAIVKQYVVKDFKGSIKVKSSRHNGTIFTIKLPVKNLT